MSEIEKALYPWSPEKLKQGWIVTYRNPNAKAQELTGQQIGMIISSTEYNQSGTVHLFVCPIITPGNRQAVFNPALGIALPEGAPPEAKLEGGYLRPDLISIIAPELCELTPTVIGGKNLKLTEDIIQRVIAGIINFVTPNQAKLNDRGARGNLPNYGEITWFGEVPHGQDSLIGKGVPALCLSPSAIWQQTKLALCFRGYTNILHYSVVSNLEFEFFGKKNFIKSTDCLALAPEIRFTQNLDWQLERIRLSCEQLEEFALKIHGILDHDVYLKNTLRFSSRPDEHSNGNGAHHLYPGGVR